MYLGAGFSKLFLQWNSSQVFFVKVLNNGMKDIPNFNGNIFQGLQNVWETLP